MSMNIAKLQAQLQHVPDAALVEYVKNPQGQVPSYLALAELSRRKEIRAAGTQQRAPQQAQPSVADQMIAGAEPGVAGLPVRDDMFNEQAMAAGGIVAFDGGGDVRHYDGTTGSRVIGGTGIAPLNRYTDTTGIADQIQAGLDYAKRQILAKQRAGLMLTKDETDFLTKQGFVNSGVNQKYAETPQYLPGTEPKPATPAVVNPAIPAPTVDTNPPAPPAPPGPPPAPEAPKVGGIKYDLPNRLAGVTVPDAVNLNRADFVGEAPTLEGIQALREQAYGKAGVSEDMYDKMLAANAERKAGLTKDKEDAIANLMMTAGLGIASGKSRNAITNIAEGALPAIKDFKVDMKDLDAKKDKLNEREFAVMEARNKFRQTGADSDLKTLTDKQAAYDVARRDYAKTDAQLQDSRIGRQFSLATAQAQEQGQTDRAILSAKLQEQQIGISAFNAQTQRMIANKPELFTTILSTLETDKDFQKADGKTKVKMITDAVSDTKSTSLGGDNTLRQKAGDSVDKVLEGANPLARQWKQLLKEDPTGTKAAAFKDNLVRQEILRRKQDITSGASPTANVLQYDPTTGTLN